MGILDGRAQDYLGHLRPEDQDQARGDLKSLRDQSGVGRAQRVGDQAAGGSAAGVRPGRRKQEILGLSWDEIDEAGGVIRLSPARSKTLVGRILPISQPIAEALARRRARRDPDSPLVFHRDGITVRRWRTAWRTACQAAGVPTRFLHDCRRTAARNLIRANVPERVAMLLTGHKSRAIFDRYNIIHEQELLDAGDQLVAYLAQQAQAVPARRRPHPAGTAAPRTASPLRLVRRGTA